MKSYTKSSILALAASTSVLAQNATTTPAQIGPFALQIKSHNATLNNSFLSAGHAGAAIEELLVSSSTLADPVPYYEQFYFQPVSNISQGYATGSLLFYLPVNQGNGKLNVSEPLSLSYSPTSNVASAVFTPASYSDLTLGFDDEGRLFVPQSIDEGTFKAGSGNYPTYLETPKLRQNWHVCWTDYGGYYYQALTWVTDGKPTNPTCKPVEVVKVDV